VWSEVDLHRAGGLNFVNALVLGNLCEYRHSIAKKLDYILLQTVYGFIFNHFCVLAPETAEFGEITQNNDHYAVQDHSVTDFGTNR